MSGHQKTQNAILKAMETYRAQVLHERYFDVETGIYKYPYQITEKEVLGLAGIKSRSTLKANYHDGIKLELKNFIHELKLKAGKKVSSEELAELSSEKSVSAAAAKKARVEQLAETIAALSYKVIALQKELEDCRNRVSSTQKVVNLPNKPKH